MTKSNIIDVELVWMHETEKGVLVAADETDASLQEVLGAFEFGGPSLAQMASDFLIVYERA